jgi:hypothetical protein
MGRVEGEVRSYLRSYVQSLIAGWLGHGFTVFVGDGFCNLVILLVATENAGELLEALNKGDVVRSASYIVVGVRRGSRVHGNMVEAVKENGLVDVGLVITKRVCGNCCAVEFYELEEGVSDPEAVARNLVEENLDTIVRYVMEEAEGMRREGACKGKRDCVRKVLGLERAPRRGK